MGEMHAPAALPQRTRSVWHRFVAARDHDLLASPLSEYIVFRPRSVQSPIPGGEHAICCRKWQLTGVTPAKFIAFEVTVHPIEALAAPGRGNREPDRPATEPWKQLAGVPR
jgi:hypothetical protein